MNAALELSDGGSANESPTRNGFADKLYRCARECDGGRNSFSTLFPTTNDQSVRENNESLQLFGGGIEACCSLSFHTGIALARTVVFVD